MQTRRQQAKQPFMSVSLSVLKQLKQRLEQYHSPEQICGRLKREGLAALSHETLYQMIYANHQGLGAYQRYLRQGHKQRQRRRGNQAKRGTIPGRVGIEHRPAIADLKCEIGHWESDTVIGPTMPVSSLPMSIRLQSSCWQASRRIRPFSKSIRSPSGSLSRLPRPSGIR
jgi:IS30 family transposase